MDCIVLAGTTAGVPSFLPHTRRPYGSYVTSRDSMWYPHVPTCLNITQAYALSPSNMEGNWSSYLRLYLNASHSINDGFILFFAKS
eukprot:4399063-Pleurochrysis_carterae.AAC.1